MQRLFLDSSLNEEYEQNGYVKIPFVNIEVLTQLKDLFYEYCPSVSHPNGNGYYSMFTNNATRNLELKHRIEKILEGFYEKIFVDYQNFAEMFLAKLPDNEELLLHQDWSYVHEQKSTILTVWLPLQQTTKNNGALFVIPGSHKFFTNYRSGSLPSVRIPLNDALMQKCVEVPVEPGEAVFFHQALFHGSYPNLDSKVRVVAASIIAAKNEDLLYFQKAQKPNTIFAYKLTEESFFNHIDTLTEGKFYHGAQLMEKIISVNSNIDVHVLLEKLELTRNAF